MTTDERDRQGDRNKPDERPADTDRNRYCVHLASRGHNLRPSRSRADSQTTIVYPPARSEKNGPALRFIDVRKQNDSIPPEIAVSARNAFYKPRPQLVFPASLWSVDHGSIRRYAQSEVLRFRACQGQTVPSSARYGSGLLHSRNGGVARHRQLCRGLGLRPMHQVGDAANGRRHLAGISLHLLHLWHQRRQRERPAALRENLRTEPDRFRITSQSNGEHDLGLLGCGVESVYRGNQFELPHRSTYGRLP